ncbi:D-cysteine desulfhydrase [Salisediminibacterium halotolerans]|uniref:D-cysteine desulfhydrase n=1 Tax=Salisediminibacterium halotolerans TaxID=517425 RepID=UPI000EB27E9B|nr:D-cysteine desulfhydrase [Salisediminibacterium halotolerans]RLJ78284.1 D-cysteine desulfhydrase [Actinophytocola xinjiangensis]RPE88377.1 D-cysteine desulfhydrase [Salisediminibacterium halotolerans]TWG37261.1 D-cysteine desulfhydrase [Salisediminibacterium halotolerans]GEL07740.1 D-cysteine desulfhydrase [Salisediminibacterium halotolerans]
MNLDALPRKIYTDGATPIEKAERLSQVFGGPELFIKRDDQLGLTEGGNKTRKLEFLIADAASKGADTVITAGAIQSNHCRLTLSACVKEGLNCRLVLEENEEPQYDTYSTGNFLIYQLLDEHATEIVANGTDMEAALERAAEEERSRGRVPYIIPVGGSNAVGMTGYAACAVEIASQSEELDAPFDYVVCASGSGGMQAGLVAGFASMNRRPDVLGMSVIKPEKDQQALVHKLANETAEHLGVGAKISRERIQCFDECLAPGYALPSDAMKEAVKLTAQSEALLLDPVYSGKAMAGLNALIRDGFFQENDRVLFIHSGGTPALYAYAPFFHEK